MKNDRLLVVILIIVLILAAPAYNAVSASIGEVLDTMGEEDK